MQNHFFSIFHVVVFFWKIFIPSKSVKNFEWIWLLAGSVCARYPSSFQPSTGNSRDNWREARQLPHRVNSKISRVLGRWNFACKALLLLSPSLTKPFFFFFINHEIAQRTLYVNQGKMYERRRAGSNMCMIEYLPLPLTFLSPFNVRFEVMPEKWKSHIVCDVQPHRSLVSH